jgi:hypothetical protein
MRLRIQISLDSFQIITHVSQYIKNIIFKTYKRNVQYQYDHENMINKALVTVPLAPIFVNVPIKDYLWRFPI